MLSRMSSTLFSRYQFPGTSFNLHVLVYKYVLGNVDPLQHWLVPSSPCRVMSFHVMILSIACKVDVVGWSPSDHEYLEEDYLSAEWVSPRVATSCRPTSHCCSGVRGLCCVAAASLSHACTASLSLCCHMCHSWVATCCSHLASMTGLRSSSAQNGLRLLWNIWSRCM